MIIQQYLPVIDISQKLLRNHLTICAERVCKGKAEDTYTNVISSTFTPSEDNFTIVTLIK